MLSTATLLALAGTWIAGLGAVWGQWRYWATRIDDLRKEQAEKIELSRRECVGQFESLRKESVARHEHDGLSREVRDMKRIMETIRDQAVKVQVVEAMAQTLDRSVQALDRKFDRMMELLEKRP